MKEKELSNMILAEAHLWAKMIAERMERQPKTHAYFGTILAYAVETLLGVPFGHKGKEYDQISKDFAKFLSTVHEDVKKNYAAISDVITKKAN